MSDRVRVDIEGGIAQVVLTRGAKHNGLDRQMFEALIAAGRQLQSAPGLRAVVLSGEGPSFCAGLDFVSFMREGLDIPALLAREEGEAANYVQQAAWVWTEVPVPVVAALHGNVFGGGLQLALAADIRYVTADAALSIREIKWGLIPDMTASQTLRHLVRLDVAKELVFTGRSVDGNEAVALGLATRVEDDPKAAATATARAIATRSPDAIRGGKRLLNEAWAVDTAAGLRMEEDIQRGLLGKPNQLEAVAAGMQKRTPKFTDPK